MARATATVNAWVLKSKKRMVRIVQGSTVELIEIANTPTAKGGNMRVDTGFLRASGQVSFNGMPTGPSRGRERSGEEAPNAVIYPYGNEPNELALAKVKLGDRIFFGWTANYARYREYKDGFMRLAVQKWNAIVQREVAKAKTASERNSKP